MSQFHVCAKTVSHASVRELRVIINKQDEQSFPTFHRTLFRLLRNLTIRGEGLFPSPSMGRAGEGGKERGRAGRRV